jgi:hypothetical protein
MAYQTILEFGAMNVVAVHELWTGDLTTLDKMLGFSPFLSWYFGLKLGMLGVYSVGRSVEKVNGAAALSVAPAWVDTLVRAIKGKK